MASFVCMQTCWQTWLKNDVCWQAHLRRYVPHLCPTQQNIQNLQLIYTFALFYYFWGHNVKIIRRELDTIGPNEIFLQVF